MLEVSIWADLNLCGPTRQEANAKQTGGGGYNSNTAMQIDTRKNWNVRMDGVQKPAGVFTVRFKAILRRSPPVYILKSDLSMYTGDVSDL